MAKPSWTIKALIWVPITLVASVGALRAASPPPATLLSGPSRGSLNISAEARGNYVVGEYTISLTGTNMTVIHPDALTDVWTSPANEAFLSAATAHTQINTTGNLVRVVETWEGEMSEQTITHVQVDNQGGLWTYGELRQPKDRGSESAKWHAHWRTNPTTGALVVDVHVPSTRVNRVAFSTKLDPDERYYGGGLSYSDPDRKAILVMPRLQGVGRGDQPLTLIEDILTGQGGSTDTSQAPLARITTDAPRSQWVSGDAPVVVDGRQSGRLSMSAWSNEIDLTIASMRDPADQIGQLTQTAGPMRGAPPWASDGLVITDAGTDTQQVLAHVDRWIQSGLTPSAVLVRNLPGNDKGMGLRSALATRNVRLIAMVTIGESLEGLHADGYMVEGAELLHLNPDFRKELKEWTGQLHRTTAQVNDPVVITQAILEGYTSEPMFINVGNLNANFSANDGLPTAISAMVNGGISGLAFTNVTVGGDTTINRPFWLGGVERTEEHIARSAQLAVFSSLFRTGLDTPDSGVQIGSDLSAQAYIKQWFYMRRALTPIRVQLNNEALKKGIPPVRAAMLVQPDDRSFNTEHPAFFYGNDIYVVPVVTAGQTSMDVVLPQGNWRDVFTGQTYLVKRGEQVNVTIDTPLDRFPVFTRVDTSADQVLELWATHRVPNRQPHGAKASIPNQ